MTGHERDDRLRGVAGEPDEAPSPRQVRMGDHDPSHPGRREVLLASPSRPVERSRIVEDGQLARRCPRPHLRCTGHDDDGIRVRGVSNPISESTTELGPCDVVEIRRETRLAQHERSDREHHAGVCPPVPGMPAHEAAYATGRGAGLRRPSQRARRAAPYGDALDRRRGASNTRARPGHPGQQPHLVPRPVRARLPRRPASPPPPIPRQARAVRQAFDRDGAALGASDPRGARQRRCLRVARRRGGGPPIRGVRVRLPRGDDLPRPRTDGRQDRHRASRRRRRRTGHTRRALGGAPHPLQGPQAPLAVGHRRDRGGGRPGADPSRRGHERRHRPGHGGHRGVRRTRPRAVSATAPARGRRLVGAGSGDRRGPDPQPPGRAVMSEIGRVAVVGAGSWGTTVAALLAPKGGVVLWAREPSLVDQIDTAHENPRYLPGIDLPDTLHATNDLGQACAGAGVVVLAVPSHGMRAVLDAAAPAIAPDTPVISLSKGVEQDTHLRMTEVIADVLTGHRADRIGVLTGPNLAREVAEGQPTASVVAMADPDATASLQRLFMTPTFRVYTNPDVVGCEIAGALKNVIAIAAGMAAGLGYGDNTKAALITRGLAELARLGVALGGEPLTFSGLAGMGDLVATCTSTKSRNRTVGVELGRGRSLADILAEMNMVAEGVKSTGAVLALAAEHGVDMPIAAMVGAVLYDGRRPADLIHALMVREAKPELHGIR